jgi:prepilin-type N-terminal cleavage/methylation domain-containing protein
MEQDSRHNAFTLIELLVVIAVIALLMAILLPCLQRVRKQAKAVVCQAHLKQWATALAFYTEDNHGHFATDPVGANGIWLFRGAFISGEDPNPPEDTMHHFSTRGIICCPLAAKPEGGGVFYRGFGTTRMEGTPGSTFAAWEITSPPPAFRGSYGYNEYLFGGFSDRPDERGGPGSYPDLDISSLKGKANIPVLLDSSSMSGRPRASQRPPPRELPGGGTDIYAFCINRHSAYINGLFLDWSVRKVGLKELWVLKWSRDFNRAGHWTKAGGVTPEDWPEWMRGFTDY